jgi:signal transduction histidine kinase/FixJ family two-component response regulator
MANKRVLVVGRPSALSRELIASGYSVDHAPANHRSWAAIPSGAWDACVLDASRLFKDGYELVRQAREIQPSLAVIVLADEQREGAHAALVSGADDWTTADTPARPAADVLSRAVAARRERARSRTISPICRVIVLDWDELEAPLVRGALDQHHFSVTRASDGRAALEALRARPTHVLITPPSGSIDGVNIVEAALRYDPRLRVIVASDHLDLEATASAIGRGAQDYLLRPVGPAQALGAVTHSWAAFANTAPSGESRERLLEVLLLESHPVQAHLVEEMLSQDGRFATTTVSDLGHASRALSERTFDAVLYRPDGTRREAIRFLHELRSIGPHPAIILIAKRLDSDLHDQALRMGAQDIISSQRLGREALGARVRNAVARNHYRLAHERFVRDLQTREASQREVVRRSVDGMLIVDATETVVFSNPAADRMFERFGTPLLGRRFPYPPSPNGHREIQIREGSSQWVAEMTEVAIDWNGAHARLISLRDITERRQAQELRDRLTHTERLAAIGQLAAGVTHEINNPAAYVVANLTSMLDVVADLERELPSSPGAPGKLREIADMLRENLDGMARIRSIASDLRTFARIGSNEVSLVDLNDCIASACKIAKSEIRQRAHLIQELSELPRIPGSPGKLAQVVLNLLINAAQAIPEGNVEANRITVRSGTLGSEVWFQVEDSGRGIPSEVREKIFDPFFTTKPRSQGTGLGLALCADIVGQHQGTIRATPAARGGTCFEVRLPHDTALQPSLPPTPLPSRVVPRPHSDRQLRLLLIDDEPLVLRSLRRMLAEHHVDVAQSGSEALSRLKLDRNYDLIFCDLMMPEMDGTILYAELERRMPDVLDRVVFCSGGAFTTRTKQFVEQSTRPFVEKPMTRETFERVVADWYGQRRRDGAGGLPLVSACGSR